MDPFTMALMAGGSSLLGGLFGSNAERKAADAQMAAIAAAMQARQKGYKQAMGAYSNAYGGARRDIAGGYNNALRAIGPARKDATNQLYDEIGGGWDAYNQALGDNFTADPGYQYRIDQAQKALERSANSGRGPGLRSGAYDKALQGEIQGLASQEYNNYVGRNQAYLSDLAGLAGMEQQTGRDLAGLYTSKGNALGGLGWQYGQLMGGTLKDKADAWAEGLYGQGMADANGKIGAANQWTNALGQFGQAFGYGGGSGFGGSGGASGGGWFGSMFGGLQAQPGMDGAGQPMTATAGGAASTPMTAHIDPQMAGLMSGAAIAGVQPISGGMGTAAGGGKALPAGGGGLPAGKGAMPPQIPEWKKRMQERQAAWGGSTDTMGQGAYYLRGGR